MGLPPAACDYDGWVAQLRRARRRQQAKQLLSVAGPEALQAIRRGLGHPDATVRRLCVNLLDRLVDEASIPDLVGALDDATSRSGAGPCMRWPVAPARTTPVGPARTCSSLAPSSSSPILIPTCEPQRSTRSARSPATAPTPPPPSPPRPAMTPTAACAGMAEGRISRLRLGH